MLEFALSLCHNLQSSLPGMSRRAACFPSPGCRSLYGSTCCHCSSWRSWWRGEWWEYPGGNTRLTVNTQEPQLLWSSWGPSMSLFPFLQSTLRMSVEIWLYHGLIGTVVRCKTVEPPVLVEDGCYGRATWLVEVPSRTSCTSALVLTSVKRLMKEDIYSPFTELKELLLTVLLLQDLFWLFSCSN